MDLFMNRKSMSSILVFVMAFLLLSGCSSKEAQKTTEAQEASTIASTVEEAAQAEPGAEPVLPSDARIGIVYTEGEGNFTNDFLTRMEGYLTAAGVAPENIEVRECPAAEMEETSGKSGGRPGQMLRYNAVSSYLIGIDLTGEKSTVCVSDLRGRILQKEDFLPML